MPMVHVGRIVGLIAKGFGMKVYAFDPYIDPVIIKNDGVVCEERAEDLYSKCRVYFPAYSCQCRDPRLHQISASEKLCLKEPPWLIRPEKR